MSSQYLKDALEQNLPGVNAADAFMMDLVDDDLDSVAGGMCGVLVVKCETTYTSTKPGV